MDLAFENDLAHKMIGFGIEIHKILGPALDGDIYKKCLAEELNSHGIQFKLDTFYDLNYKQLHFANALKADLIVENALIIVIDNADVLSESRVQNLLKMLKMEHLKLGLLINFNAPLLKNGIRRVTNHKLVEETAEEHDHSDLTT